jgi:hypothetical protein
MTQEDAGPRPAGELSAAGLSGGELPGPAELAAPADSAPPIPETTPIPGVGAVIGGGLDLTLSASRELRRASLYIGAMTLGLIGPFALVLLAFMSAQGGIDWLGPRGFLIPVDESVEAFLTITGLVAVGGMIVIIFESQILAATILGGRALGRPVTLREAVRRSRQVFWRLVGATILVLVALAIPYYLLGRLLESAFRTSAEAQDVIATAVRAVLSAPFAYVVAGIVLGDVGAVEAIRRSTRLARARWRLAIAVSAVGAVATYLLLFALDAGISVLARIGTVFQLGFDSPGATVGLGLLVLVAVLAIGSLTFQLAALRDAPQVVAFLGLTGYGAGLDRARAGDAALPRVRWISVPMAIAIGIGSLASVAGVLALS